MTRTISAEAIRLIKQWEGCKLTAYPDPGSKDGTPWTIGYGHTAGVHKGMTITQAQADAFLLQDVAHAAGIVEKSVKVPLNDNQFGALTAFTMNVGEGSKTVPGFTSSTLLKKLNKGDYAAVPTEMARWVHNGGRVMPGLVNRRAQEAALWGKGSFVSSAYVDAKPAAPPVVDKETITWGAGILATLGAVFSGTGPVQWALAAVIVIAFGVGAVLFIRKRFFAK
jgi:lysozyme